ncbi:dihydrolipoamide acetyltransferase family protein [Pelolinea submarina]|uniref:Dihydrolipoamide acetyltransferase component of pyruvate dehydrogenase complex n=1 Tax=Pelolinea submarina TaxID=913107 RepID=A0A3E0AAV7_9CHLR|nr:dihydrolipoamide acetyltransferase family protein [Pelolinea submarina]REG08612.1 pyruvate dehydrogenase E2 component (dihydrolipoamide acetyltransferase) [Pelolinea submarina]
MATGVLMPKSGISVETCILTEWNKKVGEKVKKGEVLFSYETDKSAFEEVSPQDGTLLAVFFNENDDVPVMVNVCVIGEEGEDISAFKPEASSKAALPQQNNPVKEVPVEKGSPAAAQPVEIEIKPDGQQHISPRARMLAKTMSVPTEGLAGTGPNGRVIERDVRASAAEGVSTGSAQKSPVGISGEPYTDVKLTNIRKVIAKNMAASLATIPQLTHTLSFDATEIMALRAKFKKDADAGLAGITLNDMVLFAVAHTLLEFPELNAHLLEDSIRLFRQVNLGVAVDTPRGLMVPTIFAADKLSLRELAAQSKELAAKCQNGNISPELLQGGTFTISNLGNLHIEHFTPIINPPQTGILGVNTIIQRVREVNGQIRVYPAMGLSLTYDHRAIDGAPASRFLMKLQENLESFSLLFVK